MPIFTKNKEWFLESFKKFSDDSIYWPSKKKKTISIPRIDNNSIQSKINKKKKFLKNKTSNQKANKNPNNSPIVTMEKLNIIMSSWE